MEGGTKLTSGVRKAKKKQVKDEFDRIKQAEKKKRRLEKALAASAAMCSELEKKKQKKKEEQERLDKEGAAIAEAVALHVLIDEDSGDIIYNDEGPECGSNMGNGIIFGGGRQSPKPYQDLSNYSLGKIEWVPNSSGYEHAWNHWGNSNFMMSYDPHGGEMCHQYFGEGDLGTVGLSPGHLAAQAVSSLKIGDETRMDAYVFNPMLRG